MTAFLQKTNFYRQTTSKPNLSAQFPARPTRFLKIVVCIQIVAVYRQNFCLVAKPFNLVPVNNF
jgi:hypothetical protein